MTHVFQQGIFWGGRFYVNKENKRRSCLGIPVLMLYFLRLYNVVKSEQQKEKFGSKEYNGKIETEIMKIA